MEPRSNSDTCSKMRVEVMATEYYWMLGAPKGKPFESEWDGRCQPETLAGVSFGREGYALSWVSSPL